MERMSKYKIFASAQVVAIGVAGLGFNSQDDQIARFVTNGSPMLLCFWSCVAQKR